MFTPLKNTSLRMFKKHNQQSETSSDIVDRFADLRTKQTELQNAMKVAAETLDCLDRVRAELSFAEDVWPSEELGGAFEATKAQLRSLDKASHHSDVAQRLLRALQAELLDATLAGYLAFHIDKFSSSVKSFLDGAVFDWGFKSKIHAASSACDATTAAVTATLVECQLQLDIIERRIQG